MQDTPVVAAVDQDTVGIEPLSSTVPGNSEDWKESLDRVVPCVVVLKVTQTRPFDTESACSSYATGFIVDRVRGLILTNRHVCTPGPIVAEAIFLNREELPVRPVYRDPVHDFGFLKFEPSKLQFMKVGEIPLAPEAAAVGLDIRVVGNDSGEKVSILSGVLARLDRDAPVYGKKSYNDFNTFYLQAASGTKGGSSGSPVVDCRGRAVGLNAGGKNKAQSAYYLPLDRVIRVLSLLQASKPVEATWDGWVAPTIPRGDLQTTFVFKGFDEVRRLGLRQSTERDVRMAPACSHGTAPGIMTTGMLVVDSVVPKGPAHGHLEVGDVLVRVNHQVVTHFLQLEEVMDANVGATVELQLERGGQQIEVRIEVADLHSVTPACFLEVAGGSVHALSYQQARNNSAVPGQVYVAEPGYMLGRALVPKHAIITSLASKPTPDLEAFASVLRGLPHGSRVPLEYFVFSDRHRKKNTLLFVDRQWYGTPVFWTRDDSQGTWHPTGNYPPGAPPTPQPSTPALTAELDGDGTAAPQNGSAPMAVDEGAAAVADAKDHSANGVSNVTSTATVADGGINGIVPDSEAAKQAALEEQLRSCMVLADVEIPLVCLVDGVHGRSFAGSGVVLYHGRLVGLVLLDRNTVAVGPCDVNLSFGAYPAEVSARTRFLHPLHNFALVSYDPRQLPTEARRAIRAVEMCTEPLRRGDTVTLAGVTKCLRLMLRKATVTNSTLALTLPTADVPRFRAVHEEVVKLDQDFGASFSGILTDDRGRMRALWGSYAEQEEKVEREWCAGLPSHVIQPWLQCVAQLDAEPDLPPPEVRVLDAELEPLLLSKAAQFQLPAEWVTRLATIDPERRQVLRVRSCVAGSHAAQVLCTGDMILAVNDRPVTCFADIESLIATGSDHGLQQSGAAGSFGQHQAAARGDGEAAGVGAAGEAEPSKRLRTGTASDVATAAAGPGAAAAAGGDGVAAEGMAIDGGPTGLANASSSRDGANGNGISNVHDSTALDVLVFRNGVVERLKLQPGMEDGMGTDRILHWCGAQLQAPHRAAREQGFLPESSGVYISRWHHGSPSHRYGLYALHFIAEVNGQKTPDLETFVKVVAPLQDGDFVRVKMYQMETCQAKVLTLKMDIKYWPTWELRLDPGTCQWNRITISPLQP